MKIYIIDELYKILLTKKQCNFKFPCNLNFNLIFFFFLFLIIDR